MIFFLIGPRCSGKTTVGRILADHLKYSFVDMDEMICATAGMSIPEIVEKEGWDGFRQRENKVLLQSANDNTVVATGGGVILSAENQSLMQHAGVAIYLETSVEVLKKRYRSLIEQASRPPLTGLDPMLEIEEVLRKRTPFYKASADIIVDANSEPQMVANDVLDAIKLRHPVI